MPRKPLDMRKGCVRLFIANGKTKAPWGGCGLALCLANAPHRGSNQAERGISSRLYK